MDDYTQNTYSGLQSQDVSITEDLENDRISDVASGRQIFKKDWWLHEYFGCVTIGGRKKAICLGCRANFSNREHKRLIAHLDKCKQSNYDPDMTEILEEPEGQNSTITNLFANALVENGWALNGVEGPSFKKFISTITKTWKIPSRRDLSGYFIPKSSRLLLRNFMASLNAAYSSVSIEFDHWEDANNRSFLGIVATDYTGARYLLDLRDVSLRGHHAAVIVEELVETLKKLPNKVINSIVSDSASTCKKARKDFVAKIEYRHVIQHRCFAHFMNLVGTRLTTKNESIAATVRLASKITGIISGSTYWSAYLKENNFGTLKTACPVRWFSMNIMLTALLDLKDVILDIILLEMDEDKAALIRALDWDLLREILEVVKPLSHCIGQLEKSDCTLGEGLKHILEYAKILFDDNNSGDVLSISEATMEARKSFLYYFNEDKLGREELGLLVAAYALDRRFKLDYITEKGIELCMEAVTRVALKTGAIFEQVSATIFLEFEYFQYYKADFVMTDLKPHLYWTSRVNCGILSKVGFRLANLKSSSANIERTFSSIKYIQGDYRLNMSKATLVHTARVKISSKNEQNDQRISSITSEEWFEDHIDRPDTQDQSLDESTCSQNCVSTITLDEDMPNWIEDQDVSTKRNYQNFFKYFDFAIINEALDPTDDSLTEVTDDQIRDCVRANLQHREAAGRSDVIVDSASQMQAFDAVIGQQQ